MNPTTSAVERPNIASTDSVRNVEVLNAELNGEHFGIAAYDAALASGLLDAAVAGVARKFQSDHREHAERLREAIVDLGGEPVATKTWDEYAADSPPPPLETQADVLRYAASLEQGGASAATAAVGELTSPDLTRLVASIAGAEAMHWSVLLGALGDDPSPVAFIPMPAA